MDVGKPSHPNLPLYAVSDGIAPSVSTASYFKKSDDYTMADDCSIYLIFNESVKFHPSAVNWEGVFTDLRIDGEAFTNGLKVKDDGYKVEWTVHSPLQIGSTDEWFVRIEFIANASGTPKLKGSDITFTYNAYPGRTIQDMVGNDLGSDGLKDIKFTGVRFGY